MMSEVIRYRRVVPRDFFNEAKLLKCLGHLSLKILDRALPDGIDMVMEEPGDAFVVQLLEEGSLYVRNYPVFVNKRRVIMKTTYNSKSNYPLHCEYRDEEVLVFDDDGEFTDEFVETFTPNPKPV